MMFPYLIKRLREGVDPDNIKETEDAMDSAADELEWCSIQLEGLGVIPDRPKVA